MIARIYKEAFFEASHRLLHYEGKCARLHGHQWRAEVWIEGKTDPVTGILVDYNCIKEVVQRFDHQVILHEEDPMVASLSAFQDVVTTPGDPTSELLASVIAALISAECMACNPTARVIKLRIWESTSCYAEWNNADQ